MLDRITDITMTVPGRVSVDDPWLEGLLERTTEDIALHFDVDVMLSSQGCNDDGETFRSVRDERDRLRAQIAAVRHLHRPMRPLSNPDPTLNCYTCDEPSPCETLLALNA